MAVEWFVQHGGKLYGPLTSAALKKLAAEGKIGPGTNVRRGNDGSFVPASRVQGLFAPAASAELPPLAAPPLEPPVPPPRATPMLQPVARRVAVPKAVPAPPTGAIAPKIVGGIATVLAAVAVATCWLPVMGGLIGWTGIVAGGLGLLVGAAGFVLAATRQGAGLMLNIFIFAAAGSAVGMILSIVLGVAYGMFTPVTTPTVSVVPPVVQVQPAPQVEPEPEPEPPPEPHWFEPAEAIEQPPVRAKLTGMGIEQIRLESADLSTLKKGKPQPMLKIKVEVTNTSADKIIEFAGWVGGGDMIGQGVTQLLEGSELGKAVQAAAPVASLVDNVGNKYKQVSTLSVFGAQLPGSQDLALRPSGSRTAELVFPPPLASVEYLRLELSPAAYGGSEPLRWQIPRSAIKDPAAEGAPK